MRRQDREEAVKGRSTEPGRSQKDSGQQSQQDRERMKGQSQEQPKQTGTPRRPGALPLPD